MLNVVLVAPEIPQNTGNIARTCAATGSVMELTKSSGKASSKDFALTVPISFFCLVT